MLSSEKCDDGPRRKTTSLGEKQLGLCFWFFRANRRPRGWRAFRIAAKGIRVAAPSVRARRLDRAKNESLTRFLRRPGGADVGSHGRQPMVGVSAGHVAPEGPS
jgi:hypothetical protein